MYWHSDMLVLLDSAYLAPSTVAYPFDFVTRVLVHL
jgi:hypothetical protein